MAGYQPEFKRAYSPSATQRSHESTPIGQIDTKHLHQWNGRSESDSVPRGNLEKVATQIQTPRVNQNFLAPVNDVRKQTNKNTAHTDFKSRLPTAGARSGQWTLFVALSTSTIFIALPSTLSKRNETHQATVSLVYRAV